MDSKRGSGEIQAVELFAGIGGFRMACDHLHIRTIWANDFDHNACVVYRSNFRPDVLCEHDIRDHLDAIPPHDLLTAGFPCQPFSSAGKKCGVRDPRGTLFQIVVDVLRRHSPQFFVLENVKRLLSMEHGSHFATILDALTSLDYLVEWRLLNAAWFGLPQNRQRVLIVGTRRSSASLDNLSKIRLASEKDFKLLSLSQFAQYANPKDWTKIESHDQRFPVWGLAWQGKFFSCDLSGFSESRQTVTLGSVLDTRTDPKFDFTEITRKWIHRNSVVERFVDGVQILSNQNGGARMGYTIFGVEGLAPTLTAATSRHYERYKIGDSYRRLTNVEYARIQGFPDCHCREASMYDQYALIGNAVPPPMVQWVLEKLLLSRGFKMREPASLFREVLQCPGKKTRKHCAKSSELISPKSSVR
jgi:DNA (cytosine-5)-methyltransferase 1